MALRHAIKLSTSVAILGLLAATHSFAAKPAKTNTYKRAKLSQSLDYTKSASKKKNKTSIDKSLDQALMDQDFSATNNPEYNTEYLNEDGFSISESDISNEEAIALAQEPQQAKVKTNKSSTYYTPVQASNTSSTNAVSTSNKGLIAAKPKSFSALINLSTSNSLVNKDDGSRASTVDLTIIPSYKLFSNWSIKGRFDATQDLINEENSEITSTSGSLAYSGFSLVRGIDNVLSATVGFPVTRAQAAQSLLFSTSLGLSASLNQQHLNLDQFSASAYITFGRNIHTYEEEISGRINTAYFSNQGIDLGYSLTKKLSVSAGFLHRNGISYQNEVRESFILEQGLTYAFNESFSANLGHSNSGSALKADGQTSNIEITNDDTSMFSAGIELRY